MAAAAGRGVLTARTLDTALDPAGADPETGTMGDSTMAPETDRHHRGRGDHDGWTVWELMG